MQSIPFHSILFFLKTSLISQSHKVHNSFNSPPKIARSRRNKTGPKDYPLGDFVDPFHFFFLRVKRTCPRNEAELRFDHSFSYTKNFQILNSGPPDYPLERPLSSGLVFIHIPGTQYPCLIEEYPAPPSPVLRPRNILCA